MSRSLTVAAAPDHEVTGLIERVIADVPPPRSHEVDDPDRAAEALARGAAQRAAVVSGSLALPPGPVGMLTVLPDIFVIWRIQRQMVADIAGAYGVSAELTQSRMLYCLFRHAAAQAVRDVAVQVGARLLIQDVPLRAIEKIAAKIGVSVSKRLVGRGIARWLPVIGALGVGAYAYYDTGQVARTAIDLFGAEAASKTREPTRHR